MHQQGQMQQDSFVVLQDKEGAEPWRPELHIDTLCELQDLNFGPNIKNNFTSTSVMEAKPV